MKRNSLTSLFLAVLVMPGALHAQEEAIVRREAVTTTASIAHYMIADCVKEAKLLKKDIDGFVAAPSEINLGKAKLSWTNARLPFLQVRNLLWVETEGAKAGSHRGKFDGRPVDLKAINALIEDEAGYPKIDAAAVRKAAGKEGAGRMTGLSAIETLMWLTGNEDHVPFLPTTPLAKRRGACLAACAQIYLDDMKALAAEFDPAKEGNTHAAWKAADPEEMMATIMTAQAKFVARELVVKRLEKQDKAYFPSRTSRTDIQHGVAGIANVLAGSIDRNWAA